MAIAVANRYARALADAVGPTGDYRAVLQELEDFAATCGESADLCGVFETPAVPLPEKMKVLEAILARLATSPLTSNFLRVLLAHYRMGLIEEIVEAFLKIAHDRMGVVQVKIFSAADLSEAERQALRARFAELTRKQVELEFRLEGKLLGGILAQIASTVYDGSVRGHLERIRQRLVAG